MEPSLPIQNPPRSVTEPTLAQLLIAVPDDIICKTNLRVAHTRNGEEGGGQAVLEQEAYLERQEKIEATLRRHKKYCDTNVLLGLEEFPTQPATLFNWPPLYIVPTMTSIHKSK